jgi:uncharacterized protein
MHRQLITPFIGIGLRHPHYAQVFEQRPAVDFLEVHAENFFAQGGAIAQVLDQAASLHPISLHGVGLSLGSASGIDAWHLQQLKRLVDRINPRFVSDHACFGRAVMGGKTAHANDLLPIRHTASALNVLCSNVNHVQDVLKRRIAVENISAYIQWDEADADYCETEFLNALTQRTGCGLLMDLNNVYVNALNASKVSNPSSNASSNGSKKPNSSNPSNSLSNAAHAPTAIDQCTAWINGIHPDTVMEIHLAGFTPSDTLVIDDHATAVQSPVWQLYRHAIGRLGHVPTLIEWDLKLPALAVLLAEAETARHHALEARP